MSSDDSNNLERLTLEEILCSSIDNLLQTIGTTEIGLIFESLLDCFYHNR